MKMPKLNQIIAIEKGTKNRVAEKLTAIYKNLQKGDLFTGHVKKYTPRDEDPASPYGEQLPDDVKNVQQNAKALLQQVADAQTELFDTTYLRDAANTIAKADVVVNGQTVLKDAPVPYLLWLEKQLNDLHSEVKRLPTLDPAEKWAWSAEQNMYASEPTDSARSKQVLVPLILAPATEKHPAQVKETQDTVRMGTWRTTKYSTALPADKRDAMLKRVEDLQKAVKQAREAANMADVTPIGSIGKSIFDFVLADL